MAFMCMQAADTFIYFVHNYKSIAFDTQMKMLCFIDLTAWSESWSIT